MKRISLFLCLILLVCHLAPPGTAALSYGDADAAEPAGYEGYIVKLTGSMPVAAMALLDEATVDDPCWDTGDGSYLVVDSLEEAEQIPPEYVDYIEPNYIVTLLGQPNDPLYATHQWNLREIGMEGVYDLGLDGSGVKIAFIDSGLYSAHEDLNPALITGKNFADDGKPYTEDLTGHGTFAAGIVAAQTENEKGLAGIAPGAEIMAYRAFAGKNTTITAVVNAINAAVADGCDILNLSLGTTSSSQLLQAAIGSAEDKGVVMVAAVGNAGTAVLNYPAAYSSVVGVGSVDANLNCSSFSNKNSSVFVTAPGEGVCSLDAMAGNSYVSGNGTSYSAPVVSGLAALALGYDSDITPDGLRYLLAQTAQEKGAIGYDNQYGYGVVDAAAFAGELTRAFTLHYNLNGGDLPTGAKPTYSVTDDSFPLPTPTRNGYAFAGWYEASDLSGAKTTEIRAGSLGDRTLFAAWVSDSIFAVESVMVNGVPAVWQGGENEHYLVVLPYGTDLSELTAEQINAVPTAPGGVANAAKSADDSSGASWTITVSADSSSKEYTLRIEVMQLHVQEDQKIQTGNAVPMSLDGKTEPLPYTADARAWFAWGDGPGALSSDFACTAELVSGEGAVSVDSGGVTVTYIPSPEDAGHDALIKIYGAANGLRTLDAVELTVHVNPLPFSQPVAEGTANYDLYAQTGAKLTLSLFENQITEVLINNVVQPAGRYALSEITSDGTTILTLSQAAVASLSPGNHTVLIRFNAGDPCTVTLTLTDSTPPKENDPPGVRPPAGDPPTGDPPEPPSPADTEPPAGNSEPAEPDNKPAWENPFTDVGQNDWFYEDVQYALQSGLFNGTGDNTFSPHTPLNRAMAVTVLYRLHLQGAPEGTFGPSDFADVPTGAYYSTAVPWAAGAGLVNGYDSAHFGPDDAITRQDFAVILMRYIRLMELDYIVTQDYVPFADEDEIASYAKDAMQTLYKLGVINGVGENRVAPGASVTRAQAAAMLRRLVEKMPKP